MRNFRVVDYRRSVFGRRQRNFLPEKSASKPPGQSRSGRRLGGGGCVSRAHLPGPIRSIAEWLPRPEGAACCWQSTSVVAPTRVLAMAVTSGGSAWANPTRVSAIHGAGTGDCSIKLIGFCPPTTSSKARSRSNWRSYAAEWWAKVEPMLNAICGEPRAIVSPNPWHHPRHERPRRSSAKAKTWRKLLDTAAFASPRCQLRPRILRHHPQLQGVERAIVCVLGDRRPRRRHRARIRRVRAHRGRTGRACVVVRPTKWDAIEKTAHHAGDGEGAGAPSSIFSIGRRCCSPPASAGQRGGSIFALGPAGVEAHRRRSPLW